MNHRTAGPATPKAPHGPAARPPRSRRLTPGARAPARGPCRPSIPRKAGAALLQLLLLPWHPAWKNPYWHYTSPRQRRSSIGQRAAEALLHHGDGLSAVLVDTDTHDLVFQGVTESDPDTLRLIDSYCRTADNESSIRLPITAMAAVLKEVLDVIGEPRTGSA